MIKKKEGKIKNLGFLKRERALETVPRSGYTKEMIFNFTPTYDISRDGKFIGSSMFNLASDFNETPYNLF